MHENNTDGAAGERVQLLLRDATITFQNTNTTAAWRGEGGRIPRAVQTRGDSVPVPEAKPLSCAGNSSSTPFCRGARVASLVVQPHRNLQASSAGTPLMSSC